MRFTTVALTALLGLTSAQTVHVVSVSGTDNALTYRPDSVVAAVGDMVQMQFRAGNHSFVQSTFDNPCTPISQHTNMTGIFSGYQPVAASVDMGMIPTFTFMVSNTNPMWFYCSQGRHCQAGMVMVVNENTAANASRSLTAFKTLAQAAPENLAPGSTGTNASTSGSTASIGSNTNSGSSATTTSGATAVVLSSGLSLVAVVAAALFML